MPCQPAEWNAVVLGAWNLAIVTPNWIAAQMFASQPGVPLTVEVALDGRGPNRVRQGNVFVSPSGGSLTATAATGSVGALVECCTALTRAIDGLPVTPLGAAGVNFRYTCDVGSATITEMTPVENAIVEAGDQITAQVSTFAIAWEDGIVNVEVTTADEAETKLNINFHLPSEDGAALKAWLARTEEMKTKAESILGALGLELAEGE